MNECGSKITSLTNPNGVSVGENLYKLLHPAIQIEFHELPYGTDELDYTNRDTGKLGILTIIMAFNSFLR